MDFELFWKLKSIFQRMRVYSIKQLNKHENRKRSSEVVLQLSKTVSLLVVNMQTVDVQELVTVQQMASGNFVKQVVVR